MYFDEKKLKQAQFVLIYFDKLYKTQFGGAINILKACIIDAKFGLLTQKYMPGVKLNINQ